MLFMVADLDLAAVASDAESVNAGVINPSVADYIGEPEKDGESGNNEDKNEQEHEKQDETSLL
jgi:hypothetical protein